MEARQGVKAPPSKVGDGEGIGQRGWSEPREGTTGQRLRETIAQRQRTGGAEAAVVSSDYQAQLSPQSRLS